jgi:hypothetical protein
MCKDKDHSRNRRTKGNASMPNNNWPQYRERIRERPRRNGWKIATLVLFISNVVFATTTLLASHIISLPVVIGWHTTAQYSTPRSGTYSAIQPGPGCDKGRGIWAPEDPPIDKITCGTTVSISPSQTRGYLYFQLPSNEAFSSNNSISVIGSVQSSSGWDDDCIGLAEQSKDTGFLAEYCSNGNWSIYSTLSTGIITRTLNKGITSTRNGEKLALTLKGTTLSFSIDSETYQANGISPIQPVESAITYFTGSNSNSGATFGNFIYTALPS